MIKYCLLLMLFMASSAQAVIETYEFKDEVLEARYHQFVDELRCPKCQNQNLAGSNSPIAKDLRRELHRLLEEDRTDQQIVDYMVERYGDFILYRPRFNPETALLWLAPAIFLMAGVVLMIRVFLGQRDSTPSHEQEHTLSAEEQLQLSDLLAQADDKPVGKGRKDNSHA